jgi:hypothetical protein
MPFPRIILLISILSIASIILRCGGNGPAGRIVNVHNPLAHPESGPPAGNPDGNYPVPTEAAPGDTSNPDHVVGDGTPQSCTGGGISSIGVSWTLINCLFSYNRAIGNGGNPAQPGTPGGGSGGAIYNDGNTMTLALYGTRIEYNSVNAYGSAIFFVSNDHTGTIHIENSVILNNSGGSWYTLPGISMHSDTKQEIINSTIE